MHGSMNIKTKEWSKADIKIAHSLPKYG